ncbi:uncharacterized protein VTP21DRAFT_2950 [Calcarisporiella thermophila]|uniref:uncharacterized protein n=1 Tax=Calcarisporiella thermophila TaxID=911321 RepID=UPI003742EB16
MMASSSEGAQGCCRQDGGGGRWKAGERAKWALDGGRSSEEKMGEEEKTNSIKATAEQSGYRAARAISGEGQQGRLWLDLWQNNGEGGGRQEKAEKRFRRPLQIFGEKKKKKEKKKSKEKQRRSPTLARKLWNIVGSSSLA